MTSSKKASTGALRAARDCEGGGVVALVERRVGLGLTLRAGIEGDFGRFPRSAASTWERRCRRPSGCCRPACWRRRGQGGGFGQGRRRHGGQPFRDVAQALGPLGDDGVLLGRVAPVARLPARRSK